MTIDLAAPVIALALTKILDGAASEAGRTAWTTLTGLTRRILHRDTPQPTDRDEMARLADDLATRARQDPAFADQLRQWLQTTAATIPGLHETGTTNVISGQVHHNAVQARDITGPITFGGPPR